MTGANWIVSVTVENPLLERKTYVIWILKTQTKTNQHSNKIYLIQVWEIFKFTLMMSHEVMKYHLSTSLPSFKCFLQFICTRDLSRSGAVLEKSVSATQSVANINWKKVNSSANRWGTRYKTAPNYPAENAIKRGNTPTKTTCCLNFFTNCKLKVTH